MHVVKQDVDQCDVLLKFMDKLSFGVTGVECIKLADAITWLAGLSTRLKSERARLDRVHDDKVQRAFAALDAPPQEEACATPQP